MIKLIIIDINGLVLALEKISVPSFLMSKDLEENIKAPVASSEH